MKRDRRGRFLPAAAAAAPASAAPEAPSSRPRHRHRHRHRPGPSAQEEPPASASAEGIGRGLGTGYCRLCHGKFSSRSLRNAFGKAPMMTGSSEKQQQQQQRRLDRVFFADFQRLVGVAARPDPALPQSVCKKCHAQFYKCHSILKAFIQKVNLSPTGHLKARGGRNNVVQSPVPDAEGNAPCLDLITSSPQCLHNLVLWAHNHAGSCRIVPTLQSMLSSEYCGILRAVWGCGEGHNYIMSTDLDCSSPLAEDSLSTKRDPNEGACQHVAGNGVDAESIRVSSVPQPPQPSSARTATCQAPANSGTALPAPSTENQLLESQDLNSWQEIPKTPLQEESLPQLAHPINGSPGPLGEKLVLPAALDERVKDEFSDLSEGDSLSDNENDKRERSSDDSFQPYSEKRMSNNRKSESKGAKLEEPKIRKKPGPKPGWKKKIKCEREELPNIYKCPYQGCTAVYRGADGMKKHIKEHHEEVRERPCPHPGCNKVFMIDRYLQRHVKLIHTEVRNYICDECGQTFKQRKHLSVHQMRHSGAKPLQCEICGFQCRQRASLKYHMTKHKAETELEFACDQCGKRFEKAHNLNVHMSMVHPLTQTQDKAKAAEPEQTGVPTLPLPHAAPGTADSQPVKVELRVLQPPQQEPT